jgi:hypothetical protein
VGRGTRFDVLLPRYQISEHAGGASSPRTPS